MPPIMSAGGCNVKNPDVIAVEVLTASTFEIIAFLKRGGKVHDI